MSNKLNCPTWTPRKAGKLRVYAEDQGEGAQVDFFPFLLPSGCPATQVRRSGTKKIKIKSLGFPLLVFGQFLGDFCLPSSFLSLLCFLRDEDLWMGSFLFPPDPRLPPPSSSFQNNSIFGELGKRDGWKKEQRSQVERKTPRTVKRQNI